jgi:hypothetical protein
MSPNGNEPKAKESMAETRGRSVSSGLDSASRPRCFTRNMEVEVKALCEVDDEFVWDKGEVARSCSWCLSDHGCGVSNATGSSWTIQFK